MKKLLLSFIIGSFLSCRSSYKATDMSAGLLRNVISEWPDDAKETAVDMIRKYGQPYELTLTLITWYNNGPWVKTVVSRDEILHDLPDLPHKDFLEQTIHYKASQAQYDKLIRFEGNVTADRVKGTLTARCNKEELNLLALNLAHDIMSGRRKVEDANDQYALGRVRFEQGSSHPYFQALQFDGSRTEILAKDRP